MPKYVITGGSYSGKTTLINALGLAGHRTVPEASMDIIDVLRKSLGEHARTWRAGHPIEFQWMVTMLQKVREDQCESRQQKVFFDRGIPDGLAYGKAFGWQFPQELCAIMADVTYDSVFLLDTLPEFSARYETGRNSNRADSMRVRDVLYDTYRAQGLNVVVVPVMSVERRVELITSMVE